jgi:RNA polymerase sigma factor (sigma-70 family)
VACFCEEDPEGGLDRKRVVALTSRLSPKQREVVYLRHFEGLSFREIGEVLGIPTFSAASRHRLAMRRLRKLMDQDHEI